MIHILIMAFLIVEMAKKPFTAAIFLFAKKSWCFPYDVVKGSFLKI